MRWEVGLLTYIASNLDLKLVIYSCLLSEDWIGKDLHEGREGGWEEDLAAELPVD